MENDTVLEINDQKDVLIPYKNTNNCSICFYCSINLLVILFIASIIILIGILLMK